jgi:hypothetical protein
MTNKRPLKSFIRYDGSGRAVSSSLIWRKNKPKVGNWKEVQGYECCNSGCVYKSFITAASFIITLNYSSTESGICSSTDSSIYAIVPCDNKLKLFYRDTEEIAADGFYNFNGSIYKVINGEFINTFASCA